MAGPSARRAFRGLTYKGTEAARLCRQVPVATALLAFVFAGAGCSMSNSLFGGGDKEDSNAYAKADKAETTGSVRLSSSSSDAATPNTLSEADMKYARTAVADVLGRGIKTVSAPWQNPRTGARGTVTPIATDYSKNGATCRDFLASYVTTASESWLKGEACRVKLGKWEVKSLQPWKRS